MKHPSLPRTALCLAVLTALGGSAFVAARGGAGEPEAATPPLRVRVERAEAACSFTTTAEFRGTVRAARRVEAGFEAGGRLLELKPREADVVARGEVLGRLDTRRAEARRAELAALVDAAEATLRRARLDRERTARLVNARAVTAQDVDDAREAEEAAAGVAAAARAAVARVDVELEQAVLKAPFDAVVARRDADPGEVLDPGEPVLLLLDRRDPEARVGLAGRGLDAVRVGQAHAVEVEGVAHAATVTALLPERAGSTRTVEAVLRIDATLDAFRAGDRVTLRLPLVTEADGLVVPLGALVEGTRGLWAVLVVEPDGRLGRRDLGLLDSDGGRALVRGTLRPGDRFVVGGTHRLVPGLAVVAVESAGEPALETDVQEAVPGE